MAKTKISTEERYMQENKDQNLRIARQACIGLAIIHNESYSSAEIVAAAKTFYEFVK